MTIALRRRFLSIILLVWAASTVHAVDPSAPTLADFQALAAKFNAVLTVPTFEHTPAEIEKSVATTLYTANEMLDHIGQQDLGDVAFATTIGALDDATYPVTVLAQRLALIQQTSPDAALRQAAEVATKKVNDWSVAIDYREDVYKAVAAYAKLEPKLAGEEARLLAQTMRDYHRAGLTLPAEERRKVEAMRKELGSLSTDFATNIVDAVAPVTFTRAELDGVPAEFLDSPKVETGADQYTIMANQTFQYVLVEENANSEATRKKLYVARDSIAKDNNVPLFNRILALRNDIALTLGYKSWDDYQTEIKMARTGAAAEKFVDDLIAGTQPKFAAEVAEMQSLKANYQLHAAALAAVGDKGIAVPIPAPVVVDTWDWRYYQNQIKKTRYLIDAEALRVFFPYQKVLEGMFRVYEHDFGLKFTPVEPPYKWVPDLQLYVASDAASGEPLGLFYLDMFPREGKYNHFAEFGIISGKLLAGDAATAAGVGSMQESVESRGKLYPPPEAAVYQRPVVCLVCNFPPPSPDKPSLMSHDDVVTIFHEFGHALHAITTRARFGRFAGTNVPGDFVEAPSQMLENWAWDKTVLDSFAADYRDPSKKIPAETLGKMKEAQLATVGVSFRRQLAFAKLDLVLHGPHPAGQPYDCQAVSNHVLETVLLPIDPGTAQIASFGHLADGYDAGYYGYAWAKALSADMATVFRSAPEGFMDATAGMKLRREIYEPGDSRDVGESIDKFLGRPSSIEPFLQNDLGLQPDGPQKAGAAAPVPPTVK